MANKTTEQVAIIYSHADHSVDLINSIATQDTINDEEKETLERNAKHLELIRGFTKEDNTTSIWGSEYDFSTHEAAITLAKSIYE
tara:strand:- start:272 stop:526 length:255 start_codon:yes stop_codon:yes gene_type:complete